MKIGNRTVKIFKMKNRKGFAALCVDHLTEGRTKEQAYDRMIKALKRTTKRVRGKVVKKASKRK